MHFALREGFSAHDRASDRPERAATKEELVEAFGDPDRETAQTAGECGFGFGFDEVQVVVLD